MISNLKRGFLAAFFFTAGLGLAAVSDGVLYAPLLPGSTNLQSGEAPPPTVTSFVPFQDEVGISWDEDFLYLESDGLPSHPMMVGITAWQQQVPLPHDFTGPNAFRIPLEPEYLEEPQDLTLMGPIAIAVNGIPIFHALTQSGKDAYAGGELDQWGGHCGRADDYHYHIAPAHLEEVVGKGNPVAYALDGYPIYVADPEKDKPLDECHGYMDDEGNYRYVGELEPPYVMSFFRGSADLSNRPPTRPVREFLRPLRGASITGFSGQLESGYTLQYEIAGQEGSVEYEARDGGGADFTFTTPNGEVTEESYQRREGRGGEGEGKRPPGGDRREPPGNRPKPPRP